MSTSQIERLYKKMITYENSACGSGTIDTRIRAEIFQKIMDDVESLLKKLKRCEQGSKNFADIGLQIQKLLLKEVQVIIDEYVVSQQNGTTEHWKEMYGDIKYYIRNFYFYRREDFFKGSDSIGTTCGFYEPEE